jgi:membrane protein
MEKLLWLIRKTYEEWSQNKAPRLAASLAYYSLFAISPLLVVVIQMGAWFLGLGHAEGHHDQLSDTIYTNLRYTLGPAPAATLAEIVKSTVEQQSKGWLPNIMGWIVMFVAAAGLFSALQDAIDTVWEIPTQGPRSWAQSIREKLSTFAILWILGLILAVASVLSTLVTAFGGLLSRLFPGSETLVQTSNLTISFGLAVLFFAFVFKFLPNVKLSWSDVWIGAILTALLCGVGQILLALYFSYVSSASTFGAASSFVVILLWVYYSAQFFLFGAQFTKVYAVNQGSLKPSQEKLDQSSAKEE